MDKTYREYAIEHLKQGNLCKAYVDYILGEMAKLEQIEQIMNASSYTENGKVYSYCYDNDTRVKHIREVLNG